MPLPWLSWSWFKLMAQLIVMNGVGFGYPGQTPILSGVNLEISQGDRILILGPNGSGKSTLALLIAGLLIPTSGAINYFLSRPEIGIVFQNSRRQLVGSTVEHELAFGLSLRNIPTDLLKNKVDDFLTKFDLAAKRECHPNQLSGGELRRLALASVLITEPQILILDEPLTMLDQEHQTAFLSCLAKNIRRDTVIIWFDHDLRAVRHTQKWMVLSEAGGLSEVTLAELNSEAYLKRHGLTPAPLQWLEWRLPGRVSGAIYGPEGIKFDRG